MSAKNRMLSSRILERQGLKVRRVESLDASLADFIDNWTARDALRRDSTYWNWVLNFPWMSADAEDEKVQQRYEFSVYSKDFRQIPLAVTQQETIVAFLFFICRGGRLSLKYAYYDRQDLGAVVSASKFLMTEIKPWVFISADVALNAALRRELPFHLATKTSQSAIYATQCLGLSLGSSPHLGTGDSVFT